MSDRFIFVPYKHDFSSNQSKLESKPDFGLSFEINGPFLYLKNHVKKISDRINKSIKQELMGRGLTLNALDYKIVSYNDVSNTKKYSVLLSSKQNDLEYVVEFSSTNKNKLETIGVYQVW